jgi:hypothetical protein
MSGSLAQNLSAVDAALASLGPPPAPSVRQAILARRVELRAKHAEGHSYEDLATALTQQGLPVKPNSLRAYLSGGASPSRAARSAARAITTKPKGKGTVSAANPPEDRQNGVDLGRAATEATARGGPVMATRIK